MKKVELLAPAGNMDSFKAACHNGADAIYMGVSQFNARAMAKNFSIEEYCQCIKYAHIHGMKVFLTLNTLLYDEEMKEALEIVLKLYEKGLDAVIVQDIGLAMLLHQLLPDLPLHASTQMSVYSLEQVKFLETLGFKRVVLARELTLAEIKYICQNTKLEVEVFVHGALCVSFSGQCLFSSTIGNRSANRGNCAQPCRKTYTLCNSKGKELVKNTYLLSKKDILGIEYLEKLYEVGVDSFKIEGRNKTPEYVAGVTSSYRKWMDQVVYHQDKTVNLAHTKLVLKQLFNRNGQSTGYLDGVKKQESITILSPKNTGIYLGKVLGKKGTLIKIKLEEDLAMHDGIEIYAESGENLSSHLVTCIRDEKFGLFNQKVSKGSIVYLGDVATLLPKNASVYKTSSYELNQALKKTYFPVSFTQKRQIKIHLSVKAKEEIKVWYRLFEQEKQITIPYLPELAKTKSLTRDQIEQNFTKTSDFPFCLILDTLELEEGIFIPVSKLNEIRRSICSHIEKSFDQTRDITLKLRKLDALLQKDSLPIFDENKMEANDQGSLFLNQYDCHIDYLSKYPHVKFIYINILDFLKQEDRIFEQLKEMEIGLWIPNVVGENGKKFIQKNLERILEKFSIKRIVLGSYQFLEEIKRIRKNYKITLIAHHTLNITNCYSAYFLESQGFEEFILTGEQKVESINRLSKVIKTNLLEGQIGVMTSRYCVVGSFLKGSIKQEKCTMPCLEDRYYLKDSHDYRYDVICDPMDCIMRIFRFVKAPENVTQMNRIKAI